MGNSWKSGVRGLVVITLCQNHGIPEPEFSAHPDWFSVTFAKDFYTDENLLAMGLSDRQVKAVRYVREHGRITNTEYQTVADVLKRESSRDLADLVEKGIFEKPGRVTGKGTYYTLSKGARLGPQGP
jgi:ATP-dependent DNA helicase RecG